MIGWQPQLNGHEFEQTAGDGEGQGSLECYSPQSHKDLDMTQQLNNYNNKENPYDGRKRFINEVSELI